MHVHIHTQHDYCLDEFFSKQQYLTLIVFIYPVFLHCTIILKFSVFIHYPLFFYFINLLIFISQFM
jgi:hypothetical protein